LLKHGVAQFTHVGRRHRSPLRVAIEFAPRAMRPAHAAFLPPIAFVHLFCRSCANLAIDFPWSRARAGYEIVVPRRRRSKKNPFVLQVDEPHIRQMGEACDAIRPLEIHSKLYLDFARLDGCAEACAGFASRWGLLRTQCEPGAQERLSLWRQEIERMRLSIDGLHRAFEGKHSIAMQDALIAPIDVALVPGKPDGRPSLALRPQILSEAMRIQLAQNIAGGNTLHKCEECGLPFESGATAKRILARFCKDACRKRHHYLHRSKE
jgi:hypothetical protein